MPHLLSGVTGCTRAKALGQCLTAQLQRPRGLAGIAALQTPVGTLTSSPAGIATVIATVIASVLAGKDFGAAPQLFAGQGK